MRPKVRGWEILEIPRDNHRSLSGDGYSQTMTIIRTR